MLQLRESEKIMLVMRKHWFVMARTAVIFLLAILIPVGVFIAASFLENFVEVSRVEAIINFLIPIYLMVLSALALLVWMDFYLDMWVITNERLIDIEQKGLFSREIAEIPLRHVQDVTLEVRGVIETFLKFGTIRIQTAGEREFIIHDVPNLYEAKDLILKYSALQNGSGNKT